MFFNSVKRLLLYLLSVPLYFFSDIGSRTTRDGLGMLQRMAPVAVSTCLWGPDRAVNMWEQILDWSLGQINKLCNEICIH